MVVTVFLRKIERKISRSYILIKRILLIFPHKNELLENDKKPRF